MASSRDNFNIKILDGYNVSFNTTRLEARQLGTQSADQDSETLEHTLKVQKSIRSRSNLIKADSSSLHLNIE